MESQEIIEKEWSSECWCEEENDGFVEIIRQDTGNVYVCFNNEEEIHVLGKVFKKINHVDKKKATRRDCGGWIRFDSDSNDSPPKKAAASGWNRRVKKKSVVKKTTTTKEQKFKVIAKKALSSRCCFRWFHSRPHEAHIVMWWKPGRMSTPETDQRMGLSENANWNEASHTCGVIEDFLTVAWHLIAKILFVRRGAASTLTIVVACSSRTGG